jgi:hypothetical protein
MLSKYRTLCNIFFLTEMLQEAIPVPASFLGGWTKDDDETLAVWMQQQSTICK